MAGSLLSTIASKNISNPECAIEGPVLNRFAHVFIAGLQVGDASRYFQDAVVSTGAEIQFCHGDADEFPEFVAQIIMLFDLAPAKNPLSQRALEQSGGNDQTAVLGDS